MFSFDITSYQLPQMILTPRDLSGESISVGGSNRVRARVGAGTGHGSLSALPKDPGSWVWGAHETPSLPTLWVWFNLDPEIRVRPEAPEREMRPVETGQIHPSRWGERDKRQQSQVSPELEERRGRRSQESWDLDGSRVTEERQDTSLLGIGMRWQKERAEATGSPVGHGDTQMGFSVGPGL